MFWMALTLFSVYAVFLAYDEFRFHRVRGLGRSEKNWRSLDQLLITAAIAFAALVGPKGGAYLKFALLLIASCLVHPIADGAKDTRLIGREGAVHSILSMLHPLMLGTLGMVWKFIDGAGFFLGIFLPFSTHNLRPLIYGYLVFMAGFSGIQAIYWNLIRREKTPEPERQPAAQPLDKAA